MNITDTCVTASSYRCRLFPFGTRLQKVTFRRAICRLSGRKRLPFASWKVTFCKSIGTARVCVCTGAVFYPV